MYWTRAGILKNSEVKLTLMVSFLTVYIKVGGIATVDHGKTASSATQGNFTFIIVSSCGKE